jgi:sugar lactone lactonase YvrE
MRTTLNQLTSPVRSLAAGTWVALLSVLTLCLGAHANAQAPIVVSGAPVQLGALTGGGWDGSQEPVGGTFVVGVNGDVLIGDGYAANFLQITPSGADTTLAAGLGGSAAALDSYGNAYFGGNYNANVYKIPFNAATGNYVGFTTAPTTNCLGGNQDTAACIFAPAVTTLMQTIGGSGSNAPGYAGVAFDAQGNFFFETNTLPATNPNAIYECNVACIASASATPTLIYADTKSIGALAIDPWGNIFFVDGNNNTGKVTSLNEIPLASGSYAASPTVVESYTNAAGYGNGISGLAIAGNGTLYISVNGDGLFAIPNTQSGGPSVSGMYVVSTQGGKGVALDSQGNLYGVPYNGGDVVSFIPVGSISLGASLVGTAATAVKATVFDSAASCTTPPTLALSVTEFGAATSEYNAAAGATCSTAFGGGNGVFSSGPLTAAGFSSFSVTVNFTPIAIGERNATLTIKDSANSASGTATVTGVGQGAEANLDPGIWSSYTSGFTTPYSVSVDAAGDMAVADFAGAVYWIPAGSPSGTAPTSIGSGFGKPSATTFDANGNLYIADFENNDIVEIPNVSGALKPASQFIAIPDTAIFAGTALKEPSGLGVGPDGTLYISDFGNNRVVSWNPNNGQSAIPLTGLKSPWGVAVDAANNLYVADTGNGNVLVDYASGLTTTLTPAGVTKPWGVALDPSGSLLVSDKATGDIVRVPNESGTLTVADAVLVEKNPDSALGITLDALGDLYTTDSTGAAVYAIQRTAASINFGTVVDGTSSAPVTVYVENAGNETATLGTPAITLPGNDLFTLVVGSTNPCTSGITGAPGAACQLTAVFSPITGTAAGTISTTGAVNFSPSGSATINLSGYAATSSLTPQTITGFTPPAALEVGQVITLSATGGGSGNPVVFSIDPASACADCATISGTTLTAVSAGSIEVDANEAGNTSYAAAAPVKKTITISTATAADVPGLLMSQISWSYQSGAFTDGQNPAGGSFAVTQNGEIVVGTTYNNKADFVNASTGALISQVAINGGGVFTTDSQNNLYMGHLYSSSVLKIPFVKGAYVPLSDVASAPNCTGTDTAICTVGSIPSGGMKAIAIDPAGNLYMVTVPGSTGASAIYECPASCQTGGTATLIYSDANAVSQVAGDPWGNLFFTDGVYASSTAFSNDSAASSNLWELPYTSGTGFAATPTLLQTLTVASPGNYDNQLDGVAVASNGTVYYADQNDGTFAISNTKAGGPDTAHQYAVSTLGAKGMELDANGNEWVVVYHSGGDNLGEALLGDLTVPTAQLDGAATTAPATVMDNANGCGKAANLEFTSSNSEFSVTAGTSCSTTSANFSPAVSASNYTATISFSATSGGPQTANLTVADVANGGTGTATVTGIGQETPQTITFTAPTTTTYTYASGLAIPLAATGGASGNTVTFSVDSSSTGAGIITGGVLTVTTAGSIVIDANQAGGLVNAIYYSAAPQAQLTLTVGQASQAISFTAPASPVTYTSGLTIALSATGGASGNPVTFSVDGSSTGAGTVSGSMLTVTTAGTIVIDANQAATANYAAAPQVQQTVVVNQALQAITFTPPSAPVHFIVGGITVNLVAAGGGSGNPVVFTVDKSSTGAGTIAGNVLTVTALGNLVIDANQTGNANYLAAPQAQETIAVLSALPTQTITFANPDTQVVGTPLTLTATASSGFAVSFTSGTTSVCTVAESGSTWTATFLTAGTCTITASQPGDNLTFAAAPPVSQTFTVNTTGVLPAINLNFSLSSLTIQSGTVGLTELTVNSQNNFTGTVSFACSGLPSGYTCTFNPNPITVPQGGAATTSLSVSSSTAAAAARRDSRPMFPVTTLAVAFCLLGFKKRSRLKLLLLVAVGLAGLGLFSGCGGSSSSSQTKATTTTATVTATSGSVKQSASFTIIVE